MENEEIFFHRIEPLMMGSLHQLWLNYLEASFADSLTIFRFGYFTAWIFFSSEEQLFLA